MHALAAVWEPAMPVDLAWPPRLHQATLLPLSMGQEEEILRKVHELRKGQVDDLPITIKGK